MKLTTTLLVTTTISWDFHHLVYNVKLHFSISADFINNQVIVYKLHTSNKMKFMTSAILIIFVGGITGTIFSFILGPNPEI